MIRFGLTARNTNGRYEDEDYDDLSLSPSVSRANANDGIRLLNKRDGEEMDGEDSHGGVISYSKTDDELDIRDADINDNILSTSTSGSTHDSYLSHRNLLGNSEDRISPNISSQIDEWCLDTQLQSARSPSVTLKDVNINLNESSMLWTSSMLDNLSEGHIERIRQFAIDFLPILKESRRGYKRTERGHDINSIEKARKRIRIPTLFNNDILGCTLESISLHSENNSYIDVWSSPYLNISYSDLS
ncbi:uncharacterized protein RNJ42_03282 [Nakaseomyces bracarensis]|uniref:uncharacterized protein n=1 Tax=Nakaseomyces bracarensis TaxID=273131 RepID=UPI00387238A8